MIGQEDGLGRMRFGQDLLQQLRALQQQVQQLVQLLQRQQQ